MDERATASSYEPQPLRGLALLRDPLLNKGTAFPVRQWGAREGSRLLRQWIDRPRCGGGIAPPLETHGPGSCTQGRWCPLCTEPLSIAKRLS